MSHYIAFIALFLPLANEVKDVTMAMTSCNLESKNCNKIVTDEIVFPTSKYLH